jgi:hypothetical protein
MWSPFCRPRKEVFPKAKWPPIQKLDEIDIIGKRIDGGVDLIITVSQPLDDAPDTLQRIRRKVDTYLNAIAMEGFQSEYGFPPSSKTAIVIVSDYAVHSVARIVIEECRTLAATRAIRLEFLNTIELQKLWESRHPLN